MLIFAVHCSVRNTTINAMLHQPKGSLRMLTRYGALIFVMGVLWRYGAGSSIGTVVALIGAVCYRIHPAVIMQSRQMQ